MAGSSCLLFIAYLVGRIKPRNITMSPITRKSFLQRSGLFLAAYFAGPLATFRKKDPLLSFSALGCPDWTFPQIIGFAAQHGYQGIELRGILRQLDLSQCPEFSTADARK